MQGFNRGTIISTAIHEVYPGHYVQFLWLKQAPTKVRKLLGCGSNAEGWAHYCEQMMLDEGYGNGDLQAAPGPVAGRAAAQCPLHRRDRDAHRQDDLRAGGRVFRQGRLPGAPGGREGSQARHLRPHVPGLHAGQAADPETARGLQENAGRAILTCRNSTIPSCKQGTPPIKIVRRAMLGTIRRCCKRRVRLLAPLSGFPRMVHKTGYTARECGLDQRKTHRRGFAGLQRRDDVGGHRAGTAGHRGRPHSGGRSFARFHRRRGAAAGAHGRSPSRESRLWRQSEDLLPHRAGARRRCDRDAAPRLPVQPAAGDADRDHDRLRRLRSGARVAHPGRRGAARAECRATSTWPTGFSPRCRTC